MLCLGGGSYRGGTVREGAEGLFLIVELMGCASHMLISLCVRQNRLLSFLSLPSFSNSPSFSYPPIA